MSLGRFVPNSHETASEKKEFYWRNHGLAIVNIDDPLLPWDLKEMLARFMTRRHGIRNGQGRRP